MNKLPNQGHEVSDPIIYSFLHIRCYGKFCSAQSPKSIESKCKEKFFVIKCMLLEQLAMQQVCLYMDLNFTNFPAE
jgi:hypothetical protein